MGSLSRFLSSFTISQSLLDYSSSGPFVSFFSSFSSGSRISKSTVYRRSMLRPPAVVAARKLRYNSCSFIGTIVSRVQRSGECSRGLRAFAFLKVKSDPRLQDSTCFCICPFFLWVQVRPSIKFLSSTKGSHISVCLRMQGKLAEISRQHLKLNDVIYVSGTLGSYEKLNANGQPQIIYKVYVEDLNYVSQLYHHRMTSTQPESGDILSSSSSGKIPENEDLERLKLWQLFFANPDEWWDNRRWCRKNPRLPDFKHKETRESLWLRPNDPPWVREQLRLYDADRKGGFERDDADTLLDSFKWRFND